jgi:hypothetical protein
MPNSRDPNKKLIQVWIDEDVRDEWEKYCCVDANGNPVEKSLSQRLKFLIDQDTKKHKDRYPHKKWLADKYKK